MIPVSPNWIAAGLVVATSATVLLAIQYGEPASGLPDPLAPAYSAGSAAGRDIPQDRVSADRVPLSAVAELLDREVEERLRLEDEVAALQERMARLESALNAAPSATPSTAAANAGTIGGGGRGEVNEEAFVAAGFTPEEAAFYRRRHDEISMAQLYLRDQATREDWVRSRRFVDEQRALRQQLNDLEQGMDEDTYARYLFALGRPNQVQVRRVLASSAADSAGLMDGDVLLRYDGQRIYQAGDLRRESRDGDPGEMVAVDILRDGQRIQTYVPRGPLGINMSSERVLPGG